MEQFDKLCESFGIIKRTQRIMYPRQIKLSEEFLNSLKGEYLRMKLEEDVEAPIKNRPEKFLKALQFHLSDLEENVQSELEAYQRMMDENTAEYEAKSVMDDSEYPKKVPTEQQNKRRNQIPKENI